MGERLCYLFVGVGWVEAARAGKLWKRGEDAGEEKNSRPTAWRRQQPAEASGTRIGHSSQNVNALPNPDLVKLCVHSSKALVEASAKRVVNLASQWEKHRAPLIDEHRRLKEICSTQDVSDALKKTY